MGEGIELEDIGRDEDGGRVEIGRCERGEGRECEMREVRREIVGDVR